MFHECPPALRRELLPRTPQALDVAPIEVQRLYDRLLHQSRPIRRGLYWGDLGQNRSTDKNRTEQHHEMHPHGDSSALRNR
jgi:hypothetical protein